MKFNKSKGSRSAKYSQASCIVHLNHSYFYCMTKYLITDRSFVTQTLIKLFGESALMIKRLNHYNAR